MIEDIFLKIISREVEADIVFENDRILAFKDTTPQAPHHYLVIPKQRIPTLNDLTADQAELVGEMILCAKNLAKKFGFSEQGYRLAMNCNKDAGQSVAHIHLHVLAGRTMLWPPG